MALNRPDGTEENYRGEGCGNNKGCLQQISQLPRENIVEKKQTEYQLASAEQPAKYSAVSAGLENETGVEEIHDTEHYYLNPAYKLPQSASIHSSPVRQLSPTYYRLYNTVCETAA